MKFLKPLVIIVAILSIAGFLVKKYYVDKKTTNVNDEKTEIKITAEQLLKEATTNDTATTKKYTNKILSINGIVKSIIPNDSASVVNLGDTTISTIICQVDTRNNATAKNLKEGTVISIKGRFTGISNDTDLDLGYSVQLKDCSIEK